MNSIPLQDSVFPEKYVLNGSTGEIVGKIARGDETKRNDSLSAHLKRKAETFRVTLLTAACAKIYSCIRTYVLPSSIDASYQQDQETYLHQAQK